MVNKHSTKPLYYSTYSFIAQVDGKTMEFVSEKEYEEYISQKRPIRIVKKYVFNTIPNFNMKVFLYQRTTDGMWFVHKIVQYFNKEASKETYTFEKYCDAYNQYKQVGGK